MDTSTALKPARSSSMRTAAETERTTPQELRRRIYVKAKAEKSWRFLR